jgi:uncharacterized SAM-binding protein YcdF (DUF218 family)
MFIILSKILPPFFYPIGFSFILLVISLFFFKKQKLHKLLIYLVLFIIFLSGNRYTAFAFTRSLEWQFIQQGEMPSAEVIVLLGGATESASFPRATVEVNGAGDRILYANHLFRQGKAQYILLSGGSIDWLETGNTPAQDMADILLELGVPEENLWLENTSKNTYENALECKKILNEHKIDRIILLTSASHMPRALALFEKQGLQVIPAPTDYSITQANWEQLTHPNLATLFINLLPSIDSMNLTTKTLKEYIGILVYTMRGWM